MRAEVEQRRVRELFIGVGVERPLDPLHSFGAVHYHSTAGYITFDFALLYFSVGESALYFSLIRSW